MNLTPEQMAMRERLMAGVATMNSQPIDFHAEERAAAIKAQRERESAFTLDAIEDLTRRGFKVLPIARGAKSPPLVSDWPAKATADTEAAKVMFGVLAPGANVGISCDDMLVLDVDPKSGGDASLAMLHDVRDIPRTLTARTPSGGRHMFFRCPPGVQVPNTVSRIAPGIDTRGAHGYVVGAGSRTEKGRYAWLHDLPIAPAPAWMLEALGQAAAPREKQRLDAVPDAPESYYDRAVKALRNMQPAIEGAGGNSVTFKTAARMRDLGLSEQQAVEAMLAEWNAACEPPWEPSELARVVSHAFRYAQNEPGEAVARDSDFPDPADAQDTPAPASAPVAAVAPLAPPVGAGPRRLDQLAGEQRVGTGYAIKGLLQRGSYAVAYGPPGQGKAQPLDEPVLTPDGWRPMGSIKPGDYVVGSAGLPVRVDAVYPQGDKDEWEVEFENGAVVRCCGEHLWTVYKTGALPQTITTEALAEKPHKTRWHVPLVRPIRYTPSGNPLPLDPYLLGALLGDGGITHYAGFSSSDAEILAEIRQRLPAGHSLHNKPGNNGYDYQITSPRGQPNQVWNALRLLGLAGRTSPEKEVPAEYMTASPAERLLLLQGLMDTDGWPQGGRIARFSSSSRKLTEQLRELVGSLGGVANPIYTKQTTGLPSHGVAFSLPAGVAAFRLTRKAARVTSGRGSALAVAAVRRTGRAVPMQCIAVVSTDHLYVTTGFILTHNTFVALDWSYHVAAGRSWHDRKVHGGPVLYLAYEGGGGLRARARALQERYGRAEVPLYIDDTPYNLRDREGRKALGAALATLPAKPVLIIIDTFAHALCGGDENSAQDVSAFNAGVQALIAHTGACVLVIHHPGKSGSLRGSTALLGAVDTEIRIEGGLIAAEKQRDIELGERIGFRLRPVPVGLDDDGDIVHSCVVEPMRAPKPVDESGLKEGSIVTTIYNRLKELRPTNDPITQLEWRQACEEFLPARKNAWADALYKMKRKRLIVERDDGTLQRRLE